MTHCELLLLAVSFKLQTGNIASLAMLCSQPE